MIRGGGTCAGDAPITVTKEEKACLSRETKEEIVTHNETWEARQ